MLCKTTKKQYTLKMEKIEDNCSSCSPPPPLYRDLFKQRLPTYEECFHPNTKEDGIFVIFKYDEDDDAETKAEERLQSKATWTSARETHSLESFAFNEQEYGKPCLTAIECFKIITCFAILFVAMLFLFAPSSEET